MTNLIGEYECKVDAKGRLLVPSALRKQFSAEAEGVLFVKRGIESCLEIYQKHDWERVSHQVASLKVHQWGDANGVGFGGEDFVA